MYTTEYVVSIAWDQGERGTHLVSHHRLTLEGYWVAMMKFQYSNQGILGQNTSSGVINMPVPQHVPLAYRLELALRSFPE